MSGIFDAGVVPRLGGRTLAQLCQAAPLLAPTLCCGDVAELFQADPARSFFVVRNDGRGDDAGDDDKHGGGFGLVDRAVFLPRFLDGFNREIYQRKSIVHLMDAHPLVIPGDTPIERVALDLTMARPELLRSAFVIADDGVYLGIGLAIDLMRVVAVRAQAASVAKSTFLANMSHEIRTPLNAVIGNLELLAHTPMNAEQLNLAQMAELAANSLLDLIGDLLDLSKIEADRFDVESIPMDVRGMIEEVMAIALPRARQKGLTLACRVGREVPEVIRSDPTRLRQVLVNFIGNAVKFTDRGKIMTSVRLVGGTAAQRLLRFDVVDTGIGFDPARGEALFEPFVQEDMTTTRRFGGTGLGLTISKRIAELLGGDVGCSAVPGLGANFWCTIPAQVLSLPEAMAPPTLHNQKVLLIGGGPSLHQEIADFLAIYGFASVWLEHDLERTGGERGRSLAAERWPAIIVIVADDQDAGAADFERWGRQTSALLVLADLNRAPQTLYRAYRSGAAHVLAYPDDLDDLPYLVAHEEQARTQPGNQPGQSLADRWTTEIDDAQGWLDRRPVLVIDDTATNRELAVRQLRRLGLHGETAENGEVGLAKATAGDFSLILVDGSMPVMDGLAFAHHYRAFEHQHQRVRTPLIAMTAHALAGDGERFLAAGMDAYLPKPVTLRKLAATLRTWLREGAPTDPVDATVAAYGEDEAIDLAHLADMLGEDDPVALRDLLGIFVADFPALLETIAHVQGVEAADVLDRVALARAAHAAKSAAGSAGARALAATLGDLEQAAPKAELAHLRALGGLAGRRFQAVVEHVKALAVAGNPASRSDCAPGQARTSSTEPRGAD